ncbi:hypothetical protein BC830DRAFT_545086 [Chytriomyces sp. MP71]|nr:hypothetical protein BC830DRAFT_545086 [Chytriomyces sp. MP71]
MRLSVLSLVAAGLGLVDAACTNPLLRSEWHQLTASQQSAYVAACQSLASRQDSNQQADPSKMSWHDFVVGHSDAVFWAHGNAEFYVYHRAMTHVFEQALISTGLMPAGMGIPYFDWSIMSQTWATSNIFSSSVFGAPSSGDPDNCVLDGAFAKGKYSVATGGTATQNRGVTSGDLTCLRRSAVAGTLVDVRFMQQELSASSYLQFTCQDPLNPSGDNVGNNYFDETDYHSNGHAVFGGGGDMTNPSISPNDPIFWLHHGFVDKHFWKWQKQCEQFLYDYSGRLASITSTNTHNPNGNGVDDNALATFQLNTWPFTVAQMLNTQGNTLCYTYTELATDLKPLTPPTCPPVNKFDTPGPLSNSSPSKNATATTSSGVPSATVASATQGNSDSAATMMQMLNIMQAVISQSTQQDSVVIFNRREESSDSPFHSISNGDNSTTFYYSTHGRNVTVPGNHTALYVYNGHVVGQCNESGKLKRFYPYSEVKPYIPDPDAPQNITVGQNDCWLVPPPKLSRAYVEGMNKNWQRYETQYNKLLMKYDAFNKDNCTSEYSPSSLRNQ